MNRIITVSREFGSGGREIGRRLAEKMGIAYYDQEIIAELIKRTDFAEEYIRHMDEKNPIPLLPITTARTFGLPANNGLEQNLKFYMQESKVIREFAEKSDCVIVGRCANHILKDKALSIFIYAPYELRVRNIRARTGREEKSARKMVKQMDKERRAYYEFFTDEKWTDLTQYDLCIDSSRFTLEEIVAMLKNL